MNSLCLNQFQRRRVASIKMPGICGFEQTWFFGMQCLFKTFLKYHILGFVAGSVLVGNVRSQQILSLCAKVQCLLNQCKHIIFKHS